MRLAHFLPRSLSLCATAAVVWAQQPGAGSDVRVSLGPLNPPAPLAKPTATAISPGVMNATLAAAKRAQDLGLPTIAVPLYRQLLEAPAVATGSPQAGAERDELALALTTALLDAGDGAEAQKVLDALPAPHGAAWQLRSGLAALQLRKRDAAQAAWNVIKAEEVMERDQPWYWFFTGALYDTAPVREMNRANDFYNRAQAAATTELSKARFQLAAEQVRLRWLGAPSPETLERTRKTFEENQGTQTGYGYAESYAVQLSTLNRGGEAIEFLQRRALLMLPPQERFWRDQYNRLIGMIGDATRSGPARNALNQLLETGIDPEKQRQALQLLAAASEREPGRGQLRAELTKLIALTPAHPIKESLLYYRAQLALSVKDYSQAEDDANELLKQFPGSSLRLYAFGVLTGSAWEQRRFRIAANHARAAHAELATAVDAALVETRARLGLLEAEAWFRAGDAGDFRNAADAYVATLRERPAGVLQGDLMFQRVLAEIKSGSANAPKVLDEIEADSDFDAENRWQAEWNLARELQTRGKEGVAEAYARVNRLLSLAPGGGAAIKPDLQARMAWLQARLSYDAEEFERTLTLTDGLAKQAAGVDAKLKEEIISTGALLKAQALLFGLRDEGRGLEALKKLRVDFPKSEAAVSSYLIEAEYLATPPRDRIVEAQKLLTKLADDFSDNTYAPYALYRAATLAERLGQDDNYREANRLIVDLVTKYPASDLVFPAQLKEGQLLEKLNQYPQAQQIFELLENKFPRHRDVVRAQLELAKCLNTQSSGNTSYLATAEAKFGQLRDRVDAPIDVRVEAGYNLGELIARREGADKAVQVWWHDVVQPFLLDDASVAQKLLAADSLGRYWMARTLARMGVLLEQLGKVEEAKRAWSLVLESKLGYEQLARVQLARFGIPEAKP